jgi:signal transduction histidine kinase
MQLEAAEEAIACRRHKQVGEHLRRASGLARKSLSEARRSVHALRAEALEEGSLWSALEGMIKSRARRSTQASKFRVKWTSFRRFGRKICCTLGRKL